MRRGTGLFQLGNYWIDPVPGSPNFYRFWYDRGSGEVRKRTLKTPDFEDAKIELAAIVLSEGSDRPEQPGDVQLVTILHHYWTNHSDKGRSRTAARLAGERLLDFLGPNATVGEFRRGKQRAFMESLRSKGLSVGTISRQMTLIQAALKFATADDDDGEGMLARAPTVIYSEKAVAEALKLPEPVPQNWHPNLDMIAAFLNGLTDQEEVLRRFTIFKLAFACRSEAAIEAGPFSLDRRYKLLSLNPTGRRQTKKHRPTLPVPANLWPVLTEEWTGETFIGTRYKLQNRWQFARDRIDLPPEFIPNSLRHFMATELRHAHLRYGVDRVPEDEREMWMGHRKGNIHNSYGAFEPDYLLSARLAVEAILDALNEKLVRAVFRQATVLRRVK
jgi:hypothetical protein